MRKYLYIGGIFFLCLMGWVWSQAFQVPEGSFAASCGKRISYRVHQAFESMDDDIKHSQQILFASHDRVCFIDDEASVTEYSYAYGTLWRDDFPIVSGIRAFHFEYRTRYGDLLIRSNRRLPDVRVVAYTVRLAIQEEDMMHNSRIRIAPRLRENQNKQIETMVWTDYTGR